MILRVYQGKFMSRLFITNVNYFVDDKGGLLDSLAPKSARLAQHIANIVQYVTRDRSLVHQGVTCWGYVAKKRCQGKLDANIELISFNIIWHCLKCGNHGTIINWKNTWCDSGHR